MEQKYRGIVVEEALDDNLLLNQLLVEKIHITGHKKREDRWHMYQVLVSKEQIYELANHVIDDWYIHFWRGTDIIALFSNNKQFEFNYSKKETWKDVLAYGRSIGIPEEQLDFPISEL
ncbi:hypothetical protein [Proteiniborus sp. MB09-C3]|uniref:hypothetical protein n=1 Tax=Proteiniborus sp. MB09-C3 TaxID=3050072 RepID=UPI0025523F26|nr:hypothetical protein [Proteiniborus sp. MB09-C3]WIV12745.1 hypothetical protein QO263_03250 [Proteiniborus sp. MB09-C3]